MSILFFILGMATLVSGAELLVRGASRLAMSVGLSPLVIGLTVVAYGTSTPELAVSADAALGGRADLALGNVVGSNIANVLLILGLSAIILPLTVHSQLIRQEVPIMIGISLFLLWLALDGNVSRVDAALLLVLLFIYTTLVIQQSRRSLSAGIANQTDAGPADRPARHWSVYVSMVVVGLGLLVLGAHWLVESAVAFARHLGVSELVIGLTIVAVGTSLPEIATSLLAAIRGERDIAVGNVVGSNIFNIVGVLGISGLLSPAGLIVNPAALNFDLPVMIAVAFACLPIFFTGFRIARWEGALFLGAYVAYVAYLVFAAQAHDALDTFGPVTIAVVLPLIVLTLLVIAWYEWRARARNVAQEQD
ncbi:MAG TPA: calcium/sodium antiporter [Accumulibacter sp.]|nr:calcium/sodium antiporter [Accumulibacter sp.]